ncbi:bifunctional 2-polyprenyl-6-hydroxyphenol methylase/3-demethylubiquinol 3-O-methyltransferase UbiG [Acuticoccus sp. I52.16.1]|uniref:class I SAM-dependent methyltransferase n=1 Tax=Acuticoccus sp. I52.16.1 TaxID=2928472 RepID=UPI001FD1F081|nr:methyltransferase domain-containing protein [Acuticoccus sp. I52.16.1]UOM33428.1 class I SAM-dependent methyltransferase [Acuticoccus sp. I52.16.1]
MGTSLTLGPNGRLSPNGMPPRCASCGALERHRAFRTVFDAVAPVLRGLGVLQFSPDPCAPREPFATFEVSEYDGPNHLDMAAIDRPDAAYDLVIANHVLEHVEDDIAALTEMARVAGPEGLVFLSVPDLLRVRRTKEYGYPRADKYGHWRLYGPDIVERWRRAVPDWQGLGVVAHDPVTAEPDRATILSRAPARLVPLRSALQAAGLDVFDAFAETPAL